VTFTAKENLINTSHKGSPTTSFVVGIDDSSFTPVMSTLELSTHRSSVLVKTQYGIIYCNTVFSHASELCFRVKVLLLHPWYALVIIKNE